MRPSNPRPAPDYIVSDWANTGAATAPALDPRAYPTAFETLEGGRAANPAPETQPDPDKIYQQALFHEGSPNSKVIPIPTLTPLRREAREAPRRRAPRNVGLQAGRPPRALERTARQIAQQDLFQGGDMDATPESEVICCDAPVAVPAQRVMAAVADASLVVVAAGVVLGVFLLGGGEMTFSRETIPLQAGVLVVLALFYRVLWVIADGDTPGMRFAGLRLVDFDGRKPHRDARLLRQAAGFLSLCSLGLGLVWALVDEESLTWHDHISKTFPTAG